MAFTTRRDLLQAVSSHDEKAWREFVEYYSPLILLRGQDMHLRGEELDELKQNVLVKLYTSEAIAQHLPEKGQFRTFLRTIITRCAIDLLRKRRTEKEHWRNLLARSKQCDTTLPPPQEKTFEEEWQEFLLGKALEKIREESGDSSVLAWEMIVQRGASPAQVAESLGISLNAVYLAKSRISARLEEVIARLSRDLEE